MAGSDSAEKRHFHRVGHDALATLSLGLQAWAASVQDLSLKGCLLKLQDEWPVDPKQRYHLSIHLTHMIRIDMDVRLVRQEGRSAAFHCEQIDLDSATELRRLVEYNLGDVGLLEREIHALIHEQ